MSLRGFHIVFITVVTLFFAAVAGWGFIAGVQQDAAFWNPVAWVCTIAAVVAPAYGAYFISKAKELYN